MPLTFIVRAGFGDAGERPTLTLDSARIVIGRGASCDLRLPDARVSARHASIRANGGEYSILDEGSTNGTFVGKARVAPHSPHPLRSGDLVRIASVWLEVVIDQRPPTLELPQATRELAHTLLADVLRSRGEETLPALCGLEGAAAGAVLPLEEDGTRYTVGDRPGAHIRIADALGARVEVVRRGHSVLVRDGGGALVSMLGEHPLSERDVPLRSAHVLRVGESTFGLDEPVARALAELELAPDAVMGPGERPPMPAAPPSRSAGASPASAHAQETGTGTVDAGGDAGSGSADGPTPVAATGAHLSLAASQASSQASSRAASRAASRRSGRGEWSSIDILVLLSALAVLGASIAGLVWLLRG
jgi:pSer/pThr/pTyr-binding forkhead associated (FHA) protein